MIRLLSGFGEDLPQLLAGHEAASQARDDRAALNGSAGE
jgi:hypothetical protein